MPWLVLALVLPGCSSQPSDELDKKFARAEAAATRAENAQKAAEAAAKRAENDKIAAASEEVDLAPRETGNPAEAEPEGDTSADQNSANEPAR